ncbi:hypothetical protein ACFOY2_34480 [Nonomuraea purpurea]|uniref:Uncharacterized protein n=1 Tax=Nonomuraea purpurea TaxID=1849276 RepID=A0ABV8GHF5_9ACTN
MDDLDRVEPLDGQPGGCAGHLLPQIERLRTRLLANRALRDADETGGMWIMKPSNQNNIRLISGHF